ncbi:hypothetical protein EJ08DRAFT_587143, partial [Tothia fuscella]
NLDFDARVPIPFSVFPSSYRSDAVTETKTQSKVEGKLDLPDQTSRVGREGTETRYTSISSDRKGKQHYEEDIRVDVRNPQKTIHRQKEVRVFDREQAPQQEHVSRVEISQPYSRYVDAQLDVKDRTYTQEPTYDREGRVVGGAAPAFEATLNNNETQFRERTRPIQADYAENRFGASARDYYQDKVETTRTTVDAPRYPSEDVRVEKSIRTTVDAPKQKRDMGYYDDKGEYHSIRRGVQRVAERIAHPIHGPSLQIQITAPRTTQYTSSRTSKTASHATMGRQTSPNTITIPCHHIRIGDLLILQGRPCQVIRITTSSQTGQHRYLGVDLFSKQLHEESSFISSPSPSVVVQNMLGPVFKQYRVLDIRDDGRVVAMTETGDVKQGLPVIDQSSLLERLTDSFDSGRGSVRVLVISDEGQELAVDYKVVHGSRL